jgi:hypothetical protein
MQNIVQAGSKNRIAARLRRLASGADRADVVA